MMCISDKYVIASLVLKAPGWYGNETTKLFATFDPITWSREECDWYSIYGDCLDRWQDEYECDN